MSDVQKAQITSEVNVNSLGVRVRGQRRRCSINITGESLTKQADRDRADIHKILDRFKRTGLLPQRVVQPLTGPLPDVDSFHDAMNKVIAGRNAFESLPSDIRHKFENDPTKFLEFVGNPDNEEEMVKMGLAKARQKVGQGTPPQEPQQPSPQAPAGQGDGE